MFYITISIALLLTGKIRKIGDINFLAFKTTISGQRYSLYYILKLIRFNLSHLPNNAILKLNDNIIEISKG